MVALNLDEDSEFRDALRAQGIIPPAPKTPPSPSAFLPSDADLLNATLTMANPSTLALLAEETPDSDEERLFQSYRQQRLKEMRQVEKKGRFGSLKPIGRNDWEREVTKGSEEQEEGGLDEQDEEREEKEDGVQKEKVGTGVVCFLYKDGQPASLRLSKILSTLAQRFPRTKFISIIGSQCIENYPDRNLPTLIIYRNGDVTAQIVGAEGVLGKGEERDIQALLVSAKGILTSHLPLAAHSKGNDHSSGDEGDSDDEEWGGQRNKKTTTTIRHGTAGKMAGGSARRQGRISDEDDDFDL
ncbi:thioredoxin-like protein [Mrakia frigida]|uniref:Plp2p n=1 Tax=Mrakia frigida TaxID=29902 RepID=UPI003FCC0DD9